MNEFEQYLASNYGLKPGDDVPDDIYDRASAEFLQSRTTVPSIAPNASAFDLDRAVSNAAPAAPADQPRQQEANPLQGTPFDYGRAVPILEQFASDYIDKENLVRGAKYGDKADIEADWMNSREGIYGPALQELGVTPAKAQIAAISVERGKARNMLEALGIPEPQSEGQTVGLAPEVIEQIRGLQQARDAELQAADSGQDDAIAVSSRQRAAAFDREIDALKGTPERSPWDKWQELRRAEDDITVKTEMNGGTVSYRGVPYSFDNFTTLTPIISRDRADILTQLASDKTQLPVSRVNATVKDPETGKVDMEATAEKYANLLKQARAGDPIEDFETGEVRIYTGPQEAEKDRDFVPKSLQPALRGAREVAGKVYDKAAPFVRQVADNAATTMEMITRPARENLQSLPAIALARYGLEYLSEVGRKAEEEEKKKKLAGQ